MRVTEETGLPDLFEVVVDKDAEPVDRDEALADFLLRFAQRKQATSAGTSAADRSLPFTEALRKRQ